VIAVRRAGLIVALGALLGLLGGSATASPALADGRGGGWVFNAPENFTVPAGFCPFAFQVTQPGLDKSYTKAIQTPDGSLVFFTNGVRDFTFTNPANGESITTKDSGLSTQTLNPDGSFTAVQNGVGWVGIYGGLAAFGLPAVFVSSGKLTLTFDPNGNITSASLNGHVSVDICSALS
jgi:hypothetical protein